jgi:hypothetical protein
MKNSSRKIKKIPEHLHQVVLAGKGKRGSRYVKRRRHRQHSSTLGDKRIMLTVNPARLAKQPKVERAVRGFNSEENLVEEIQIKNIPLRDLQQIFGVPRDNPMYDCYPVETTDQKMYLEKHLGRKLNTGSCSYFVECDALS